MATYVLVHGAWQGATTWERVVPLLLQAGHRVFTPTLTGLGSRGHQLTRSVDLSTHIQDVLGLLKYENLQEVILAGHSYAGMVISGVAEAAAERISHLVYIDAFVPVDGASALSMMPQKFQDAFRDQAKTLGDGWRLPGFEKRLDLWGLKEGPDRDFVRSKLCDFSLTCFEQPVKLPRNALSTLDKTYVACVAEGYPARPVFQSFADRAKREGWGYHELATGHDCHVEKAGELARILLSATHK